MPASEPEYEALSPERSSAEGSDRATGAECSPSPDGDPSTPMSPAGLLQRSQGSEDDMWEALDFQPQAQASMQLTFKKLSQDCSRTKCCLCWILQGMRETWTLGPDFLTLEPALRARLLNLQARLSRALQVHVTSE